MVFGESPVSIGPYQILIVAHARKTVGR